MLFYFSFLSHLFLSRFSEDHSKSIEQGDENIKRSREKERKALLIAFIERNRMKLVKQD
jgi:hypothetical protein